MTDVEITVDAPASISLDVIAGGPPGPAGPAGPAGPPGGGYVAAEWDFNQNTTSPPAQGSLRMNSTTYPSVTQIWIHELDRDNLDRQAGLNKLKVGDQLLLQSAQGRATFLVASTADSGVFRTIGVTHVESTGTRGNAGSKTTVYAAPKTTAQVYVPAGGTTGQVLKKLSNADYDVGWG